MMPCQTFMSGEISRRAFVFTEKVITLIEIVNGKPRAFPGPLVEHRPTKIITTRYRAKQTGELTDALKLCSQDKCLSSTDRTRLTWPLNVSRITFAGADLSAAGHGWCRFTNQLRTY